MIMNKQNYYLSFLASLIFGSNLLSQSTSVFDACYFKRDGIEPPLKSGKGFHINDVYKQTNYCFTTASCSSSHLKPLEAGQKTMFNLYYTKNEEEFNNLKNTGNSGKISFLNIFSIGNQNLESFKSNAFQNVERLVLIGKIDFGIYAYDNDLILSPQAKALITKNKTAEFIELYGTHYISGIRKENSIWVILSKTSSGFTKKQYSKSKSEVGINISYKAKGNLEISEGAEIETLLNENAYTISVEINGPPLKTDLIKNIQDIINGKERNKLSAIKDILNSAIFTIANPAQSKISQYYYTPFTLKGLKGLYWDERKQGQLTKINEAAMQIYSIKSQIEPLASFSGQSVISKEFEISVDEYSKKKERKTELFVAYKEWQPNLKFHKLKLDSFLVLLEKSYNTCSDIFSNTLSNNITYEYELKEALFNAKEIISRLDSMIKNASLEAYDEITPTCQKENTGTVTIINESINAYDLYCGDKLIKVIPGRTKYTFKVHPGIYNYNAIQRSGYLLFATQNKRTVVISKPCEDFTTDIGFQDK